MAKSKEHKKANVKPFMVKNYLSIFVNCMIENPAFDSQVRLAAPANGMSVLSLPYHLCLYSAQAMLRSVFCLNV